MADLVRSILNKSYLTDEDVIFLAQNLATVDEVLTEDK